MLTTKVIQCYLSDCFLFSYEGCKESKLYPFVKNKCWISLDGKRKRKYALVCDAYAWTFL